MVIQSSSVVIQDSPYQKTWVVPPQYIVHILSAHVGKRSHMKIGLVCFMAITAKL